MVDNADAGFLGRLSKNSASRGFKWSVGRMEQMATGARIPTNFTADVMEGRQGRVGYLSSRQSGEAAAVLVEMRVARAMLAINAHLLELAVGERWKAPTATLAALRAREDPVVLKATHAGRRPIPTGFNLSLPGVMVMYLMMNLLIFGGVTMAWERRSGVLRRIAVHPVTQSELLTGKLYGLMLLAGVQILFLLLCGRFLFGVNLGDSLGESCWP